MSEPDSPEPLSEADAQADRWQSVRQHRYCVRGDILHWIGNGTMELADLITLFDQRMTLQRQHGRVFVIIDARQISNTPAEARRYAAQYSADPPFRGAVVLIGASLLQRTVVSLVSAAARLLGRDERDLGSLFFAPDAGAAEALVAARRHQLEISALRG